MKIRIKCVDDVKKYLEKGLSAVEVSIMHWEDNVKLMEQDKFEEVKYMSDVCALCFIYDGEEPSSKCNKCPLTLHSFPCGKNGSLWHPIQEGFDKINELKDKVSTKCNIPDILPFVYAKIYKTKCEIIEHSRKLLDALKEIEESEKNKNKETGRRLLLDVKYYEGSPHEEKIIELNETGIFVAERNIDRLEYVVNKETGEVLWGFGPDAPQSKKESDAIEHSFNVKSQTYPYEKEYIITYFEDEKTGEEFGAKCSCPAFKFGTTRPCKHMKNCDVDEAYTDEVIDKRRNFIQRKW